MTGRRRKFATIMTAALLAVASAFCAEEMVRTEGSLAIVTEYPRFNRPAVDAAIQQWLSKQMALGFALVGDRLDLEDDLYEFGLNTEYETLEESEQVVSVEFLTHFYPSRSPDPVTRRHILNIVPETGGQVTLDALFGDAEKALAIFSEQTRTVIRENLAKEFAEDSGIDASAICEDDRFVAGTAPEKENYDCFGVTARGVLVRFQPEHIMASEFGRPSALISWESLAPARPNAQYIPTLDEKESGVADIPHEELDEGIGQTAAELLPLAEKGNPRAEYALGMLFLTGEVKVAKVSEGLKWLEKAAEHGSAEARKALADLSEVSEGIRRAEADKKAAAAGDAEKQLAMVFRHSGGYGVDADAEEALRWLRLAAENGNPSAQTILGSLLQDGTILERDDAQALEWMQKASDQGFAQAQFILGSWYENGIVVEKDPDEAEKWYEKAARNGNGEAAGKLLAGCEK